MNANHTTSERKELRQLLRAQRLAMPDRLEKAAMLQSVLRIWLIHRTDHIIGAYWPIHGEFDPLPSLYRWQEAAPENQQRRIGLPVVDKLTKQLTFHAWYPGCPMEEDAYGIPKPKDTEQIFPTLLLIPCVGYGPGGVRLGYGGGFYDRTLATLKPQPDTVGLAYSMSYLPDLVPQEYDIPLSTILTENGVSWPDDR
ncbi:5-formyltetrahydrofolate cyclo-ligase [Saezia sanguinis]|uniref:5-formyltetrahydrofolate cyclo-ligase n=1 Tax=Saezia sanguinis TaxID=1965230 RepID=A0A433SC97_9BURK|nr:5-formyltetrahydrofolate cyclo-ligase [Saezia sanguinis]RUS66362.1 5-formyltetrahydrofolate cyclo-ligase [Saezia sanguinis]